MNEKLKSLNLKDIIGHSIQAEEKSRKFYKKFVQVGKATFVKERFKSLMRDEELHKKALLNYHKKVYGDKNYSIPVKHDLPPHEDFENLDNVENLIDALEKAIENENNAIRIYEYTAGKYKKHSDFFKYLASMEHGHRESLSKEKELYERKPEEQNNKPLLEGIWSRLGLEGM
ncbi:MAG: ferritin family protein [Candidatus Hadarchaeia archaeon]